MKELELAPCTLGEAMAFVAQHHRTHRKPRLTRLRFAVAATAGGQVVGVAVVGDPVARRLDDGWTTEVRRVCTLGHRNACSLLYSACWRAARALGYRRLVTYTLPAEGGASLRAAGWRVVAQTKGGSWNRRERPRVDAHPTQGKLRWEAPT